MWQIDINNLRENFSPGPGFDHIYIFVCVCSYVCFRGRWFLGCPAKLFDPGKNGVRIDVSTEMPSKRRSGNRHSKDRTNTRDTRETIGLYIYIYIYINYMKLYEITTHFKYNYDN